LQCEPAGDIENALGVVMVMGGIEDGGIEIHFALDPYDARDVNLIAV
jgi:hypothetical protein